MVYKEGCRVINNNWINDHPCSLPHNVLVIIDRFVRRVKLLLLFQKKYIYIY